MNAQKIVSRHDQKVNVKVVLSGPWVSMLIVFTYVDIFGFWRADVINGALDGRVPGALRHRPVLPDPVPLSGAVVLPCRREQISRVGLAGVRTGRQKCMLLATGGIAAYAAGSENEPIGVGSAIDQAWNMMTGSMRGSPGAHAYYQALRDRGMSHHAALSQLANRLVGILHGCLKTNTRYDEHTAWSHHIRDAA